MSSLKKWSLPAAAGAGIAAVILLTVLLCLPGAALIDREVLPLSSAPYWAAGSACAAACAATLAVCKIRKRQTLPTAASIAAGAALFDLLCAVIGGAEAVGPWMIRLLFALFTGGLLGAVLSIRQNAHKKRRR